MGGTRITHPAFAQIAASRVNGRSYLYGSDFEHNGYLQITIRRSQLSRSLSRDYAYGPDELIQVSLSNAQWAEFVSTMNSGMGLQCTLEHLQGQRIPELPAPVSRVEQSGEEFRAKAQGMLDKLRTTRVEVEGLNIPQKAKTAMLDMIYKIDQELQSNIPFYAQSFGEHMETTVEKAKIEINAYVESRIHRAGLAALNEPPPLVLDASDPKKLERLANAPH